MKAKEFIAHLAMMNTKYLSKDIAKQWVKMARKIKTNTKTMLKYKIMTKSLVDLGTFNAKTTEDALNELAKETGFKDLYDMMENGTLKPQHLDIYEM